MSGRGRVIATLSLFIACASGAACNGTTTALSEDQYVEVVARLTWSRVQFEGTPQDDSLRAAVLEEFGVTGAELLEFADRHGAEVDRMERIWEAVRLRVEALDGTRDSDGRDGMLRLDSLADGTSGR